MSISEMMGAWSNQKYFQQTIDVSGLCIRADEAASQVRAALNTQFEFAEILDIVARTKGWHHRPWDCQLVRPVARLRHRARLARLLFLAQKCCEATLLRQMEGRRHFCLQGRSPQGTPGRESRSLNHRTWTILLRGCADTTVASMCSTL